MESIVLVTDRAQLRDAMRHALGESRVLRVLPPVDWVGGQIGATRDRLFILDIPTVRAIRERLAVAERWPQGFAGHILAVLSADAAAAFQPSPVVEDVLLEPFGPVEAGLRVRTILWRSRAAAPDVIVYGELRIDATSYEVTLAGEVLDLTYKEYELLRYLAANPGRVLTRDILLSRVWGEDYYGGTRTVDVHIRRLRVKLGPRFESVIGTVRNVGYRFQPPASSGSPEETGAPPDDRL